MSHAGVVSKWLNLSQNCFDHLVAPSFCFFSVPCADTQFQREPLQGGDKYTVVGKIGDFLRKSPFISETVRDRPMVTMER